MGTTTCQPMDASGGLPVYSAQNERQALAALMGGGSGRSLGARPGFRVGTPGDIIAVTSTTWTAQKEFAAVLDPASSTTQGPYRYAYVPLPSADSGSITPADATYPRKDIIVIRVDDASAGDSSGARQAPLAYRAGAATSMTPVAPSLGAREFLVGTITVPQVGGGSPTFTLNPQYFVAAGAKLPIFSPADKAALSPYLGMEIQRLDLAQVSAGGIRELWNGSTWDHFGQSEWTFSASGIPSATVWGTGALTNDAAATTDTSFVTTPGADRLTLRDAGLYDIHLVGSWGTGTTGRSFSQIGDGASNSWSRSSGAVGENLVSTNIPNFRCGANTTIFLTTYLTFASGTTSWTGRVRVTRKG